jgi:hypothetical protein
MTARVDPVPTFERIDAVPPKPRPHFVKEDEKVIWVGKPLLRAAASQVMGFLVGLLFISLFGGFGAVFQGGVAGVVIVFLLFLILIALIGFPMIALSRMVFVITDSGAYTRSGVFGEKVNQTSFEKITDITYHQDVPGRVFGYGSINVNTAGSTGNALTMLGLPNALEVKRLLERAKAEQYRSGRRDAGWEEFEDLPYFVPKADVARARCEQCGLLFKRPRQAMHGTAACPHCGQRTPLTEVRDDGHDPRTD